MVSDEHLESVDVSVDVHDGRKGSSGRQRGEGTEGGSKRCEINVNGEPKENVSSEETVPDQGGKYFLLP